MTKKNNCSSLYVHIPFCDSICGYCDFCKLIYNYDWAEKYLTALFLEIDSYHIQTKMKTIYVGGGTPTSLNDSQFERLLAKLSQFLDTVYEFSVEGNVESLTISKLEIMKKYGVNRLSIGVQTSNEEGLKLMERNYTFKEAKERVKLAKKYFDNINVDLIYAYPNEVKENLENDIKSFIDLDVDHISTYSLILENATKFCIKGYKEASQEIQREFYDLILNSFRKVGYERYEVSNFARNKKYSNHNLVYWKNMHYYGVGLGASGYLDNMRYTNTRSLTSYLKGKYRKDEETINSKDNEEYFFLTHLRLANGFLLDEYKEEFGIDFKAKYKKEIELLKNKNLLIVDEKNVKPTDEGIMLLDRILVELFAKNN